MDATVITAIFAGTAGLVTFFFGVQYWRMLNRMVTTQTDELDYFRQQFRSLLNRVDTLESNLAQKELELQAAMNVLDDYVGLSMKLQEENKGIRSKNADLWSKLLEIENKQDQK